MFLWDPIVRAYGNSSVRLSQMTRENGLTATEVLRPLDTQQLGGCIQGYLLKLASSLKMPIVSCMLLAFLFQDFEILADVQACVLWSTDGK